MRCACGLGPGREGRVDAAAIARGGGMLVRPLLIVSCAGGLCLCRSPLAIGPGRAPPKSDRTTGMCTCKHLPLNGTCMLMSSNVDLPLHG